MRGSCTGIYWVGTHVSIPVITEAGPVLGVHLGPDGLVVGFVPQPDQLN